MINRLLSARDGGKRILASYAFLLLTAAAILLSSSQTACFKKTKVPVAAATSGPMRVVILPFAVPANNKDLQWAAMAAPALMAKVSRQMPELNVVPFWESMPSAIASAGATRSFTDESATALANWVGAKWAIIGELRPTKTGYSVVVDFIPAKSSDVPFRFIKTRRMETIGQAFQLGLKQWLRFVTLKPVPLPKLKDMALNKMQPVAEALDQEYGWFMEAKPGSAQEAISNLDPDFAKILFSPTLYPGLAGTSK